MNKLAEKQITKEQIYKLVENDFTLIPQILKGITAPKANIRYGCAKLLMDLSTKHPEKLYPHMNTFAALLESKYRILVWNALAIIANLSTVDHDKKIDDIFKKYYKLIDDPYMVTVANTVGNSSKIALAKPYLIPNITKELLRVEDIAITPHLTEECKRVIAEQAIVCFNVFFDQMDHETKKKVIAFAKRQLGSSRKTLDTKSELFLKKWANKL